MPRSPRVRRGGVLRPRGANPFGLILPGSAQSLVGYDLAKDLGQRRIAEAPFEFGAVCEDVGTVEMGDKSLSVMGLHPNREVRALRILDSHQPDPRAGGD